MEDGRHGFSIPLPVDRLREAANGRSEVALRVATFDSGFVPIGGEVVVELA
jgi:hypothetical protein